MAFTTTITRKFAVADEMCHEGTWTTDTTGGDIETGLKSVDFIMLQETGSAVAADRTVVNETLPLNSGDVTIVCTSGVDGYWRAFGH